MNYKKKRDRINAYITKCINAKTSDEFYQASAKLFFYITTFIYNLDFDKFRYIDKDCE